ncbi:hypothetical protein B0H13DRAFT_1885290 [Mycena leptocephala]|nr:hypothetical protein B0H13DRAFT_1885290 [Mycena leptocephala]
MLPSYMARLALSVNMWPILFRSPPDCSVANHSRKAPSTWAFLSEHAGGSNCCTLDVVHDGGVDVPFSTGPVAATMNYTVVVMGGAPFLAVGYYYFPHYGGRNWFTGPVSNAQADIPEGDSATEEKDNEIIMCR